MSLMEWLAEEFDAAVMQRGEEYFKAGDVRITKMTDARVVASVSGGSIYKVTIVCDDGDDDIQWQCTCPYDMGPCKHIWATLRAAEEKGWSGLEDLDEETDVYIPPVMTLAPTARAWSTQKRSQASAPDWQRALQRISAQLASGYYRAGVALPQPWPAQREICYVIDLVATVGEQDGLHVDVLMREPRKNGQPGKWKRAQLAAAAWASAPEEDRLIAQMLRGCPGQYGYANTSGQYRLESAAYGTVVHRICQTGRCHLRNKITLEPGEVVRWDDGEAWEFRLVLRPRDARLAELAGAFRRGEEQLDLSQPQLVLHGGLMVVDGKISRLNHSGAFDLLATLRREGPLPVAADQLPALLQQLCQQPHLPPVDWPESFAIQEVHSAPQPMLKIRAQRTSSDHLTVTLSFSYDGVSVPEAVPEATAQAAVAQPDARRMIRRDLAAEAAAKKRLDQLGCRMTWDYYGYSSVRERQLKKTQLSSVVLNLTREGWQVEADGKTFRSGGKIQIEINSGIDWFDLNGRVDFGETGVALPKLLAALDKGEKTVLLDDGTMGIVPEEWLEKYAPLAQLGDTQGAAIRFSRAQAGFLDALLAAMPEARCDETFTRVREELASFRGIKAAQAPTTFSGQLRDYQKEGLGWLHFLQKFGFGGCLADDMGLGKTIQVLALLEQRRQQNAGTSLAVVPRSLIFNWMQEAGRFTPDLRVLDHSSPARQREKIDLAACDLVLTTYGTLRRDIGQLKDIKFDYLILDESQAIKNASTQSAKASRLLRGRHRLALSGTPIENHLGELWSLFEFLNPGMLGSAGVFRSLIQHNGQVDSDGKTLIAKALRPFILRRTKGQVARELPDKVEQTIYCELQGEQRKLYDELKEHYRKSLLGLIEKKGMARSKIQILEALLRLRQAACHPALIDKSRADAPSAKLESLMENLKEVASENHKILVFSQFTSMLAIVKKALTREKITFEYLDGQTINRQNKVERFQGDPTCPVFLISLKAGGVGLNLTAAEYVFLLDPWWNPAVEAQAVDRAHRIGQSRTVFAYRLIAKDTVEEKVLELQRTKRDLADAIITQDNSLIARMGPEELRMLLS